MQTEPSPQDLLQIIGMYVPVLDVSTYVLTGTQNGW